ncbi:MAG TPA: cyclase family protein [Herpetosiphonaceae bacterium]
MCLPETLAALNAAVSRRDVFKGVAAAALGATLPQITQAEPARSVRVSRAVDLTHIMGTQMPVFPGYDPMRIDVIRTHDRDGYYVNRLTLAEHTGTHMDAPLHFAKDGLSVHAIPAERLIGPLAVIDIRARVARDPDAMVMPDDILVWERRHGRLPAGAIVIMNSGWATRIGDSAAFLNADAGGTLHFPGWSKAATDLLMNERRVIGIGVDTLSLDHGASKDFAVHYSWLPSGRWGLENVANLTEVSPAGAMLFVGAPKVYGGSGGPTRLIAVM